jgi:predicted ATPase
LQESALPVDIRALLVARLDQVSRKVRNVIQTAAVLGREFEVQVLTEMLDDSPEVPEALAQAEQANIWFVTDQHRYIFSHALLRDAAYAMMIRAQRIELHAVALRGLEKVYAGELERYAGRLAHHAERARMAEKALYYLCQAAGMAADSYQNSLALDYFTRALAFAPPDDLARHFDIVAERVELYARQGKRDLQLKDLNALARWAEHLGDMERQARALMMRSSYHFALGEYLDAIECAQRADEHSPDLMNTDLGFFTHLVWSQALLHLGRLDEAMQLAQTTLARIRAAGNRKEEARLLTSMGLIAMEQKEPAHAREYLVEALEQSRHV